ncbi:hypothetical protein ES705_14582 [subsurface metagenome]
MAARHNPLQLWQLEQIEAECALLQAHATDPSCPCESDTEHCIRKHLLIIEALSKEAVPMVSEQEEKQFLSDLADNARTWRKAVEQLTIGAAAEISGNPDGKKALRTEQLDGEQVIVYKELEDFHEGSIRTLTPDAQTLLLVGCPTDRADYVAGECVCRDTGERGCVELHSKRQKE